MAFSDYKHISQVQQEFNITYQEERFLAADELSPSAQFLEEFTFNYEHLDVFASEGSRSELLILPLLREAYKPYAQQYELWVQKGMAYDEMLRGTPDYLLATRSELGKTVLALPLVMVAEAKRNDFEEGWGQCLAELVAAQKLNRERRPIYGIVTDGQRWDFGRLDGNMFTKHAESYTIGHLGRLYGALKTVFQLATSSAPARKPGKQRKR
jgi:hypothetical protein